MFGILHIDNAAFFSSIFNKISRQQGYTYFHSDTISNALAVLKTHPVDLIITGTYIEDQSLLSVIDVLTESLRTPVPIVVFSSNYDAETRNRLYEKGIVGFYEKSASLDKLMHAIERVRDQKLLSAKARTYDICVITRSQASGSKLMKLYADKGYEKVDLCLINELGDLPDWYGAYIVDLEGPYHFVSDVIYALRNLNPEAIILCLLEYSNYDLIHDILLSGADDYVIKPYHEKLFFAEFLSNVRNRGLIDQVKRQNEELKILAIHDGLTQLYNRAYIMDKLHELKVQSYMFSVCMLDLDYFKHVNDTFGHQVGDLVLTQVAQIIREINDINTISGRYGGEEFLMIGIQKSSHEMQKIAEAVRRQVEDCRFDLPGMKVTVSGGVSEISLNRSVDEVVAEADHRLYEAKSGGRNKIVGSSTIEIEIKKGVL